MQSPSLDASYRVGTEEARARIARHIQPLGTESVSLANALGRVLRQKIVATHDLPPFDNSGMDGYAVQLSDLGQLPATLQVTQEITAGTRATDPLERGACAQIMTGAPIPPGTEAIVPVEWTDEVTQDRVLIKRCPARRAYIRTAGRDVRKGETVLPAGVGLTPPSVGMAAAAGYRRLEVSVRPQVSVMVTGDELHMDDSPLPPGMIHDANGPALLAQARHAGAQVTGRFVARDTWDSVRQAMHRALEADVLIVSGGVSVGTRDLVKEVLEDSGVDWDFWRVRQRPGGPLAFGTQDRTLVFGLPGNPVSASVCFEQYVRPALLGLLGCGQRQPRLIRARLAHALSKKPGLHQFVRGVATPDSKGILQVSTTGAQASNLFSSMNRANCLIHLAEALEDPPRGTQVPIEWLSWARFMG